MIINALLSIAWGWICQQTEPFVDMVVDVTAAWNVIVKYTIGIFFIFPMFLWTFYKLLLQFCSDLKPKQNKDVVTLAGLGYFMVALGVGTGVVFGHMTKK